MVSANAEPNQLNRRSANLRTMEGPNTNTAPTAAGHQNDHQSSVSGDGRIPGRMAEFPRIRLIRAIRPYSMR